MILGAFDIKYMFHIAVKGQVLADLVAKFTESPIVVEVEEQRFGGEQVSTVSLHGHSPWKLYVDGAANQKGFRVGVVIVSLDRITTENSLRLGFSTMNNEAEYEALLVGVAMVKKLGGKTIEVFLDSRLVIRQVKGELEARDLRMQGYLDKARLLQSDFESFSIQQVPRNRNAHAHSLATLATSSGRDLPRVILVEDLDRPTEEEAGKVGVLQIRVGPSSMDPIVQFLKEGVLHLENIEVERAVENRRWLLVGTDYFTKLVDTESLSNIKDVDAKKFVWKNILT
ncbi:uncharacterized protein LOC142629832 [Castanea sativa]|uniref:uncharacterized protein LOC142629832 n=1 Tax=Castanea sativa TaxID=21020 RepID=UPI003F64DAFC